MAPKFRKLDFFENIQADERFGHPNSRIFFVGANFIASRRRGSYLKCFVKWLHRREIAPAGAFAHTNAFVQSVNFPPLDRIFVVELDRSRTFLLIIVLQYVRI